MGPDGGRLSALFSEAARSMKTSKFVEVVLWFGANKFTASNVKISSFQFILFISVSENCFGRGKKYGVTFPNWQLVPSNLNKRILNR